MKFKDYYATLEVARDASQDEIKRAYRKLARKYHPDVNKDREAEQLFKEISEAYEVLKDPNKRAAYDQFGPEWLAGQDFKTPPGWDFQEFTGRRYSGGGLGREFSDFFEHLFGQTFQQNDTGTTGFSFNDSPCNDRGQDIHARLLITLEESYHGAQKTIHLAAGGGAGAKREKRALQVTIPRGIIEGQQIRLEGQGESLLVGGRRGDLFLEVVFEPHPVLGVQGRDVSLDLPITPWEAALGAKVTVPTLDGMVEVTVPAGSQTGRKLRLRGKGLSSATRKGDQLIVLQIHVPVPKSKEEKQVYEEMARRMPFNPRSRLGG